ncbi:hypothetical protein K474DRAFT_1671178 [Panus rudis PR-1116 ss-1]|nr:hypothetical protein K474DRAFT_1671178 [Panus rudis PR-1116 ss-1]
MSSAKDAAASSSSSHQYEFWHPPQSSHSDAGFLPHSQDSSHLAPVASVETVHDEEWRKYEAFPSAYPPTPYVPGRDLPHQGHDRVEGITEEEALKAEEWRKYEPFPSAYPATPLLRRRQLPSESQQIRNSLNQIEENGEEDECSEEWHGIGANSNPSDFRVSLEPQHELSSPEHVDSLSDELAPNPGVQIIVTPDDGNMDIDDDEDEREADDDDMGDEEDDFNVTLRTPLRVSRRHNFSQASTATEGSQSNSSTGLNTSDSGQLLRTRLNPEVPSNVDSALAAGRKRPLPITENDELRSRVQKLEAVRAVGVNVRRRPTVQTRLSATTSRQSSSEPHVTNNHSREGYEGKERSNDSSGPSRMSKRRRVVPPAQARPGSSRTNSARTNSAGTVSGVTASTQPHEPVAATSSRKPSRATPPLLPPKAPNSTTIHTYQPVPVPACTGTDNPPLPPSKPSRAAANFSGRPTRSAARK